MNYPAYLPQSREKRRLYDRGFLVLCIAAASMSILVLITLLLLIVIDGAGRVGFGFVTGFGSKDPAIAGIWPAMIGSIWLMMICAVFAIPLGVGTAVLLEEYKPTHPVLRRLHGFVQLNITNLAGVPSIVYGILGISVFATMAIGPFAPMGTMNQPSLTLGQIWYHEYADAGGNYFYVRVHDADTAPVPPSREMVFLDAPWPGAKDVSDQVRVGVVDGQATAVIVAMTDALNEAIKAARPSRRGPARIDPARADAIAERVLAAGPGRAADPAALKADLVARLLAMDGLASGPLRQARRQAAGAIRGRELDARGLGGLIAADTRPQARFYRRPWYLQVPFGSSVLAGGLTLMLVVLPIIIVAAQEAVRAVPLSMRAGCLALGGTKWQAIAQVVLPAAIPGICTGTILAMSRAIGEAAPIIMLGAVFVTYTPGNLMDGFSAMPLQIFQWAGEPDKAFHQTAAAGIIVLLVVLLSFNVVAVLIRQKFQQPMA